MLDNREFNSLTDICKNIVEHDTIKDSDYIQKLFNSDIFTLAEIEELNKALKIIVNDENLSENKKIDYLSNLWKVNYYEKPPTMEQFLTEDWIGLTYESLFPYIKDVLIDYFNPLSKKRHLLLAYPIGSGKSTLSVISALYVAAYYNLIRSPKQYLKLSEAAPVVISLLSFTQEKTHDILIKPALNILSTSNRFERCMKEESLLRKVKESGNLPGSKLYYTTAGEGSVFRIGNLLFKSISEKSALLGLNILMGIVSEINFFTERGYSQEYINDFYWDLRGRIMSRFPNSQYLARTILDSSVSSFENELERYMWYDSHEDETNMFIHDSKWNLQPTLFPQYLETKKTFFVFKGNANKEPRIVSKEESDTLEATEIIEVPIDLLSIGKNSINKLLKDYASIPLTIDAKLINNYELIENIFVPYLKNIYMYIILPSSQPPEGLLWGLIKSEFFIYNGQGNNYTFYRNARAERFISLDLAVKHDAATLTMSHIEKNLKGEKIYVIDFTIVSIANKGEINLDAFKFFIYDLVRYGGITVKMVSFDQFQSDSSRQFLLRHDIDVINFSVDRSVEPYYSVLNYMTQGRIKAGRNVFLKNNFKSLVNRKLANGKIKVDHVKIDNDQQDILNLDWEKSKFGYGAKDASDSLVASISLADQFSTDHSDFILDETKEANKTTDQGKKDILNDLQKKYNLVIKK